MPHVTLADATDLAHWADRLDSQARMPRLMRLLIHATVTQPEKIGFPADEGVQLGGWDGIVSVVSGNAWVPAGLSVWEIGTNKAVKGKADDDYEKRKLDTLGLAPSDTTFVFITPRRWGGKEKWLASRRAEGFFCDVRAYDADDLAAWLEQAPAVHVWLTLQLGKRSEGMVDLSRFWSVWANVTRPPISPELMTIGRGEVVARVHAWLRAAPSALGVQADSREEALAFFVAALHALSQGEQANFLSRGLVVTDANDWQPVCGSANPLVLVPMFPQREGIAGAVEAGHHVLVPVGKDEGNPPETALVPALRTQQALAALGRMGVTGERSMVLATIARRSMAALRRAMASDPAIRSPAWARPAEARALLPALLAGTWNDRNERDREALKRLSGMPYAEISRSLVRWSNEPDPPVRRSGDAWILVSKEDAWPLLSASLTRDDWDRLKAVCLEVLGELDPKFDLPADDRWRAGIQGSPPAYSALLCEGLADTLAFLGARGSSPLSTGHTGQELAGGTVRVLLRQPEGGWRRWASLCAVLPLLAEAAPDEFLGAVEAALADVGTDLPALFSDAQTGTFGSPPHTGLLWALENIAWQPEYLGRVAVLLARLARLDPSPESRQANRPFASLLQTFSCWSPQTGADFERRLRVLGTLQVREPDIAWNLVCGILPELHVFAITAHRPRWREWTPDPLEPAPLEERRKAVEAAATQILSNVGTSVVRWASLLSKVAVLPTEQRDAVAERLCSIDVQAFSPDGRAALQDSLRGIISRHRAFPEAGWSLPSTFLDRLEYAYGRFQPEDLLSRHTWLFSRQPRLLDAPRHDWRAQQDALEAACDAALREIEAHGGVDAVLDLAGRVERPDQVGSVLGQSGMLLEKEDDLLSAELGRVDSPYLGLVGGFIWGRRKAQGPEWATDKISGNAAQKWSPEQRAEFCTFLPFDGGTWDVVASLDTETERRYWEQVQPLRLERQKECERAVARLIGHARLPVALDLIALYTQEGRLPVPPTMAADVLERVAKGPLALDLDWASLAHGIAEVLTCLEASGEVEEDRLAKLEWAFLLLLEYERRPVRLYLELAHDPEFFVQILGFAFKAEAEEKREYTAEEMGRARLAYELLDSWRRLPGIGEDGSGPNASSGETSESIPTGTAVPAHVSIDAAILSDWVHRACEATRAAGLDAIGSQRIGQMLAASPAGADGYWPHEAVRDVIEEAQSEDLETGLEVGLHNSRGVTKRAYHEGGGQEEQIARNYGEYAAAFSDNWPRTAAMLRRIAASYRTQARDWDARTEQREDLGH